MKCVDCDNCIHRSETCLCDISNNDEYCPLVFLSNPSFDNAIIGLSTNDNVIYDYNKMIEVLLNEQDMGLEEAIEFIDFNTIRALPYMGDKRPIIMYDDSEDLEYAMEERK